MDETKKPFACDFDGCGMSFTNEDHLSVHTKKHAMCLQLSLCSKAASFVVDQTPTPTRLIRNCDEVGLFEDLHLQHVNPFDETFRRAVETKGLNEFSDSELKNADDINLAAASSPVDESLHTPRVLPLVDSQSHQQNTSTTTNYTQLTTSTTSIYTNQLSDQTKQQINLSDGVDEYFIQNQIENSNSKRKKQRTNDSRKAYTKNEPHQRVELPRPIAAVTLGLTTTMTQQPNKVQTNYSNATSAKKNIHILPKPDKPSSSSSTMTKTSVDTTQSQQKSVRERLKDQILNGRRMERKTTNIPLQVNDQSDNRTQQSHNVVFKKSNTLPAKNNAAATSAAGGLKQRKKKDEQRKKLERNREAAKRYRHKDKQKSKATYSSNLRLEAENYRLKQEIARYEAFFKAQGVNIPAVVLQPVTVQTLIPVHTIGPVPKDGNIASNQVYCVVNPTSSSPAKDQSPNN